MCKRTFLNLSPLRVEVDAQARRVRIFNPADGDSCVELNLDDVRPLCNALDSVFQTYCIPGSDPNR